MIGKLQKQAAIPVALPQIPDVAGAIKRHKGLAALVALLLIGALVAGTLAASRAHAGNAYLTQTVLQQDLTQNVTASGTVNPQNTVTVGTQVSGTISEISVDYNSKVRKGEVLARLDPSQLQAQLDQAQGQLAQAQAQAAASQANAGSAQSGITVAQANSAAQAANARASQAAIATADSNVAKAQSAYDLAEQTLTRDKALLAQGYIAQSQYDADDSNAVGAQSALKSAQAAAIQARAQASASVSQAQAGAAQTVQNISQAAGSADTAQAAQAAVQIAQAQVQQDRLNVDRAVITSPVDGTVIARNVSVGQTVAASFQTPTLFTIAQDLKKMEVDISVGEPDIGNVRTGDAVDFTVLAYPNRTFTGKVEQVRVNPTTVNNVVTYDVIVLVDNPKNLLLPGMTANASIAVATAHGALVVPTQALAFRPSSFSGSHHYHGARTAGGSSSGAASAASPWGATSAGASAGVAPGGTGVVFVQTNRKLAPVRVKIDLVSGTQAAVTPLRGSLGAGDQVVIGDASAAAQSGTRSGSNGAGAGGPMGGGIGRALR